MLRQRDRDAEFIDYVDARRKTLLTAAYFCCGSWNHAEDILQTALAKLYVAWPRVRRSHGEEAYVRKIIVNTAIDESRRPWRRERAVDDVPDSASESPEVSHHSDLMRAMAELPPGQRRVVVLRHWLGLSVEEAATELGISIGTVKSQTAHGLAALRARLGASYQSATTEGMGS